MDILVQQNIAKKSITIIDIGLEEIKVLDANISKGKIKIAKALKVSDVYSYYSGDELNGIEALVQKVVKATKDTGIKNREVRIILPGACIQHKIIEASAVKDKELSTFISNEAGTMMSKAASTVNCTDWCVIGKNEMSDESTKICIVTSIQRKIAFGLAAEFEKVKLKVTLMTVPFLTMKSICDLYKADYENPVKMFVDLGGASIRLIVSNAGEVTFIREIRPGGHGILQKVYDTVAADASKEMATESLSYKAIYEILSKIGVTTIGMDNSDDAYTQFTYTEYGSTSETSSSTDALSESGESIETVSSDETDNTETTETTESENYEQKDESFDILMKYGINSITYNDVVEACYDNIISEIIKTLDFCGDGINKPTKLVYYGGIAKANGFVKRLADAVDISVEEFDCTAHSTGSGYTIELTAGVHIDASYANALGVAIDVLV